jgi:hypothetical protein
VPDRFQRRLRHAATALLLAAMAPAAAAQGSSTLPLDDLAYLDIERLANLGVLDSVILGQRPYSRREVARIVRLSRAGIERLARDGTADARTMIARRPLARLESRFSEDRMAIAPSVSDALVDYGSLTARGTDARRRGFSGNLTNALEATIDPLAVRRLGQPAPRGASAALEVGQRLEATPWLSLQLRERIEGAEAGRSRAELLQAGIRARAGNVALRVGREQTAWALAANDGLMLASDAPALDLVSISGDAPFGLPGFLGRLGPAQGTLLLAELGPSRVRSRSKLLAYKVSVLPNRDVELGATFLNHFGGEGGRSSAIGNRLIDFLPFVDVFRGHNYTDTTRTLDVDSDKQLGVDGRFRLPRLGGLVVSGELVIDDFDVHRIPTLFTWDGAQSVRVTLPVVGNTPVSVSLTARHTGVRTYIHGALSNGLTSRGRLLGDELGPDAKAFGAESAWEGVSGLRIALGVRSTIYSRANYVTIDEGNYFSIRRVGDASNEQRDRIVASVAAPLRPRVEMTARLAGERIRNADFGGGTRRDYAAEVALRYAH